MIIKTVNQNKGQNERTNYHECSSCAREWKNGILVIEKYDKDNIPMYPIRLEGDWNIYFLEKGKTIDHFRLRWDEKEKQTRII